MAWKVSKTLTAACCALVLAAQEDPRQTGPLAMVIQYKCAPSQRVALRQQMMTGGLRHFAQWKAEGILASYLILFSRYVNNDSWDMLALLNFANYSQAARWKNVEHFMPAGVAPDNLALISAVETYPADLMRENAAPETPEQPVYFVIPYGFTVPPATYLKYADNYVLPQFEGWMKEGILSGYKLYLQRYTAHRPWDSLVFLKYKDDDSFGRREKIVSEVRAKLQSDPTWKAVSDGKQNIRSEREGVIADELVLK